MNDGALQVIWNGGEACRGGTAGHVPTGLAYDGASRKFVLFMGGRRQAVDGRAAAKYLTECGAFAAAMRPREPCLVFVADDGLREDYFKLGPLARSGVPFTLALTRDYFSGKRLDGAMNAAQVDEMVGWGCEIAAHGLTHRALHKLGAAEMREEIEGSVAFLGEYGWQVSSFIYPYGAHNTEVRRVLWEGGLAGCKAHGGPAFGAFDRTAIPRVAFGSFFRPGLRTEAQYKALVSRVFQANGMLVFMLHPANPQHDDEQQRALSQVVDHARQIGMRICTLREAVARRGPVWQGQPGSLRHWELDNSGTFHHRWTGGCPVQAGWGWLSGDSSLRDGLWWLRGRLRKLVGR